MPRAHAVFAVAEVGQDALGHAIRPQGRLDRVGGLEVEARARYDMDTGPFGEPLEPGEVAADHTVVSTTYPSPQSGEFVELARHVLVVQDEVGAVAEGVGVGPGTSSPDRVGVLVRVEARGLAARPPGGHVVDRCSWLRVIPRSSTGQLPQTGRTVVTGLNPAARRCGRRTLALSRIDDQDQPLGDRHQVDVHPEEGPVRC